jgi:hypothetical protein
MTLGAPLLPELFEVLSEQELLDEVDWTMASRFAERWKISVADALVDLNLIEESTLAKALAEAHHLDYLPHARLDVDLSDVSYEDYEDLVSVGAAPLMEGRLAICNPYDDLRGYLGNRMCARHMIVTERSGLYEALRRSGAQKWLESATSED